MSAAHSLTTVSIAALLVWPTPLLAQGSPPVPQAVKDQIGCFSGDSVVARTERAFVPTLSQQRAEKCAADALALRLTRRPRSAIRDPGSSFHGEVEPGARLIFSGTSRIAQAELGGVLSGMTHGFVRISGALDGEGAQAEAAVLDLDGLLPAKAITVGIAGLLGRSQANADVTTQQGYCFGVRAGRAIRDTAFATLTDSGRAKRLRAIRDSVKLLCSSGQFKGAERATLDSLTYWSAPAYWNLRLEVGRRSLAFVDTTTSVVRDTTTIALGFTASGAAYLEGINGLLIVGARWQRFASSSGAVRETCTAVGVGGATQCRDAATSAPVQRHQGSGRIELRLFPGSNYGLNPRVTHDFVGGTTAFEFGILGRTSDSRSFNSAVIAGFRTRRTSREAGARDDRVYLAFVVGADLGGSL